MHDLIRDMGRKIVQDRKCISRLWKDDEILDVLQTKKGTENIEAIQLNSGTYRERMYLEAESFVAIQHNSGTYRERMYLKAESFVAMSELRMLRLGYNVHLEGEFKHFPKKLTWLEWHLRDLDSLPDGLDLENIVVLDLSHSIITQLWNPQGLKSTKVFGKMKVLKLAGCGNLTSCPDFTRMPHLKKLDLNGCREMSELHPSIGHLKSLTHLTLRYCVSLKRVPQEIWQLTSLEELDLLACHQITICPDLTSMPHLQKLNFESCKKMSELHPSIGLLKSLIDLNLSWCSSLKELTPEKWQLTSLEMLDLEHCSEITALPSQLGNCKSLARLSLRGCKSLMELPEAVCQLTSLKELYLIHCDQLEIIPDVSSLKGLQKLDLSYCKRLVNLLGIQGLDKLEELDLSGCENLIRCPLFSSNMTHLRTLDFGDCANMTELDPSIGHLKSLSDLILGHCESLKELPQEVSQLTSLTLLDLTGCYQISALPESMSHLQQLNWLSLQRCSSLTEIPDCICSFLNLEELDLSWTAIEEMPHSIVSLENLGSLLVSHCYRLKLLPSLPPSLTILAARGCRKLEDVPDIKQIKLLRVLDLGGCRSLHDSFLERLEEANFQNLEEFCIPGRRLLSYPQSPSFLLPKQFETGVLYLHVDKSSLDDICSELDESNGSELVHKSIPSDEAIDSQLGRVVLIEITTGDAKFQFSALIGIQEHETSNEEEEFRKLPTATFGWDSELMRMAKQGKFKGNGDARLRTMMTMRVSIDGCVLLHGDLFTYTTNYLDWLDPDPIEADDNFVIVKFDWPF
ncbi:Disease resistance protein [Nymphaea thermarum]|nr:Disease resistance protein [Nymphaea thermarum]